MTLNALLEALAIYRERYDTCDVPAQYVIPHDLQRWPIALGGKRLGANVARLRLQRTPLPSKAEATLAALGFNWCDSTELVRCVIVTDAASETLGVAQILWDDVIEALSIFMAAHGHCHIAPSYVVPRDAMTWPRCTWGLRLAEAVSALEAHAFVLSDGQLRAAQNLGLLSHVPSWFDVTALLNMYRCAHGRGAVPLDFVVPKDTVGAFEWPLAARGMPLGEYAWAIGLHERRLGEERRRQLDAIDFCFNTIDTWAHILDGIHAFLRVYGHLQVPGPFVVPVAPEWPADLHGLRLGHYYHRLELLLQLRMLSGATRDAWRRLQTEAPPLSDNQRLFEKILKCVANYKEHYRDAAVPKSFVVPDVDSRWERSLAGFELGAIVDDLRRQKDAFNLAELAALDEVGFMWDPSAVNVWPELLELLKAWTSSTMPDESGATDVAALQNRPMGYWLVMVEAYDAFAGADFRDQVAALGFPAGARWVAKVTALACFQHRYNHLFVPSTFVVPATRDWPRETHRLPLGDVCRWLRHLAPGLALAKKQMLDDLGFEWVELDFEKHDIAIEVFRYHNPGVGTVPASFVVPPVDGWPKQLRGLPLGLLAEKRAKLLARMHQVHQATLDLLYSGARTNDAVALPTILSAFRAYADRYHTLKVPLLYTEDDGVAPMPLGFFATVLRDQYDQLAVHASGPFRRKPTLP
ncbi:hypothetical protein ACHHYP_14961 [Achlya hypogyna]|uniref:Helicase-associated domain-containing protein n=1 Tax=Achlya hypogyna TaxID=1202772 RepID=A0A1V9YBV9_ACHHY|nr:hypothetical protein ACHHYP_14961 [Achlya hypogyna]